MIYSREEENLIRDIYQTFKKILEISGEQDEVTRETGDDLDRDADSGKPSDD